MQGILLFVVIHTFKSKITWFVTQTSLANQQGSGRWRTVSRRQKESPGFCNQGKTKGTGWESPKDSSDFQSIPLHLHRAGQREGQLAALAVVCVWHEGIMVWKLPAGSV